MSRKARNADHRELPAIPGIADASVGELRSHLTFVRRRYPTIEEANPPYNRLVHVEKLLEGLIGALERRNEE